MTMHALAAGSAAAGTKPATLTESCGHDPGSACRLVWDLTHSKSAAQLTQVYLGGPVTVTLKIIFVLALAVIVRAVTHRIIRRLTSRAAAPGTSALLPDRAGERRQQRAHALGSILGNAASIIIFGLAAMTILGDLGINLAPVLASAGVLGVALGFGAQSLVGDFLAGVSMLLEDQYGVGDMITNGVITGTVEEVGLRVTSLRDVNGVVWHIRNGTIQQVGNQSQGWARAVIDFPVPYNQDFSDVREIMTRVSTGMWQEPEWHSVILEEPKVWGVQSLTSTEAIWRLVAMTTPPRQYEVERELRERIKAALDARGITTAPTLVTLAGTPPLPSRQDDPSAGRTLLCDERGDSELLYRYRRGGDVPPPGAPLLPGRSQRPAAAAGVPGQGPRTG
jgi:moderate conductance mechanosensitive channel